MSYLVKIIDGPAEGWSYHTSIPPDAEIAIAPLKTDGPFSWMRVPDQGVPAWPEQRTYYCIGADGMTEDGDIVTLYRLKEQTGV